MSRPRTPRPLLLRIGLAGAALEAALLVVAAIWMVVDRPEGEADALPYGIGLAVTLVLFAALVAVGVRALARGLRWGRGPVITWQLLQGITAATMWGVLPTVVAVVALVLSVVVTVALLSPSALAASAEALGQHDDGSRSPT